MFNPHLHTEGLSSNLLSRMAFERSTVLPAASYSFGLEKISLIMGIIGGVE